MGILYPAKAPASTEGEGEELQEEKKASGKVFCVGINLTASQRETLGSPPENTPEIRGFPALVLPVVGERRAGRVGNQLRGAGLE